MPDAHAGDPHWDPEPNGYFTYGSVSLSLSCTAGAPTNLHLGFTWNATHLTADTTLDIQVFGYTTNPANSTSVPDTTVPITAGDTATVSKDIDITGLTTSETLDISFLQNREDDHIVMQYFTRPISCSTPLTAPATPPTVTGVHEHCDGSFTIDYSNPSDTTWTPAIFENDAFATDGSYPVGDDSSFTVPPGTSSQTIPADPTDPLLTTTDTALGFVFSGSPDPTAANTYDSDYAGHTGITHDSGCITPSSSLTIDNVSLQSDTTTTATLAIQYTATNIPNGAGWSYAFAAAMDDASLDDNSTTNYTGNGEYYIPTTGSHTATLTFTRAAASSYHYRIALGNYSPTQTTGTITIPDTLIPTPTATPAATPTTTATPTSPPTATPTTEPTPVTTATPIATAVPTVTPTPTSVPTATSTPVPTPTPTTGATPTTTPTATPTTVPSPVVTPEPTVAPTATPHPATPLPTFAPTATPAPVSTPMPTVSVTPVATATPTMSPVATSSPAPTISLTSSDGTTLGQTPTLTPGQTISVSITGLSPTTTLDVTLHSTVVDLGTITTNSAGNATIPITIPTGFASGNHEIEFATTTGQLVASVPIHVISPATTTSSSKTTGSSIDAVSLASTGTNSSTPAWIALTLLTSGICALGVALRRRVQHHGKHQQ